MISNKGTTMIKYNFIHLSHTDLDGYCCQYMTKKIYTNAIYLNANYGFEVKENIKYIFGLIKNSEKKDIFLLITDINLSIKEAIQIDDFVAKQNSLGFNIKLQLLDHHISGLNCANRFSWYKLDDTKSASKITYEYLKTNFENFEKTCENGFDDYIKAVNAVDIWLEKDIYFEYGKVLLTMISKSFEINSLMFDTNSRNYRFYLIEKSIKLIHEKDANIKLDETLYFLKKDFMRIGNTNDTFENIRSQYISKILSDEKEKLMVKYLNYKGILTYSMGNISILANKFLKTNNDIDFFMDINKKGRISIRSNDKIDVSKLAFDINEGGGHKNAAGVSLNDFREDIFYTNINNFIQQKLDNI